MVSHIIRKGGIMILLSAFICSLFINTLENTVSAENANIEAVSAQSSASAYSSYLEKHSDNSSPESQVSVDLLDYNASKDHAKVVTDIGGRSGQYVEFTDSGEAEWHFNIEEGGLYNIGLEYYTTPGKGSPILKSLKIDGEHPFDEAVGISFPRVFTSDLPIKTGEDGNIIRSFQKDSQNNDLSPSQVEINTWQFKNITDNAGIYNEPLKFYLSAGEHKIAFESIREPSIIGNIIIYQVPKIKSDDDAEQNSNNYTKTSGIEVRLQGETAIRKSDSMLSPTLDYSTPSTEPSSPTATLLNTIGGAKWQSPGQWLEYDFYVPESGLYKIGIKARQNVVSGQPSYRKLYIDGEIPYQSASAIKFLYSTDWTVTEPCADDKDGFVYLEKDKLHTIRLEVSNGDLGDIIRRVNDLVEQYLSVYRNMLMIIGPEPDTVRDYGFDVAIPEEIAELARLSVETRKIYDDFVEITVSDGQQAQILHSIAKIAEEMSKNHRKIAKNFSDFGVDIAALGSFLSSIRSQPLEIDYISVVSPDKDFEKPEKGLLKRIAYALKQFVYSFFVDYSAIGSTSSDDAVTVWLGNGFGGRDQADVLNKVILDSFGKDGNVKVNLKLVPPGSLLNATLAAQGPDVALSLTQSDPINYAIRDAVADISQFESFKDVEKRFMPSAMESMRFNGKVYGLPETQSFYMMFYREDILNQLNISIPQTWDDVIAIIPTLEKQHFQFGLPLPYIQATIGAGLPAYSMFLFQKNGELYTEGGVSSALNSEAAIDAFNMWTRFYTDYGLLLSYDGLTRFRTGETPILIADYGFYNQLSVAAPELEGRWKFELVPGTKQPDGSINRNVSSSVTACVIMNGAKNKQHAWKFLDWWTSADTQQKYGREIESVLGAAGRYQPANIDALYQIPWKTSDFNLLTKQMKYTIGIPEVPGSYMTSRYLDFAFKQVVVNRKPGADTAQVLIDAGKLITGEMKVKRAEFGLVD